MTKIDEKTALLDEKRGSTEVRSNQMAQTSVEKLRDYYNISKYLDATQKTVIKQFLKITEEDEERLIGFEQETEFSLTLFLLGWCKEIIPVDESFNPIMEGQKTTDYLITTVQGKKIALEVKSTRKKDDLKFSNNLVETKKQFAQNLGYDFYFAIKHSGHWMVLSCDYVLSQDRKISFEKDFIKSEFETLFGERLFLFEPGLQIVTTYSKQSNDQQQREPRGLGIHHPEFGEAVRIHIKYKKRSLYVITTSRKETSYMTYILENVEDVMSNQKQKIIKENIDKQQKTIIVEELTQSSLLKLSAFLLAPIKHTLNEHGDTFTFQQYLDELRNKENSVISREIVLAGLRKLDEDRYPVVMFLNGRGKRLQELTVPKEDQV